MLIVKCIVWWL